MDIATRKHNTTRLTNAIERLALSVTNNNRAIAGLVITTIHAVVVGTILWLIVWAPKSKPHLIKAGLAMWAAVMAQHWYFGGCWGVRSERKIWRTRQWYGPWTSLFAFLHSTLGIPRTSATDNAMFVSFAAVITTVGILRLRNIA